MRNAIALSILSVLAVCQVGTAQPLQGGVEFRDRLQVGAQFDETLVHSMPSVEYWYRVPPAFVGSWEAVRRRNLIDGRSDSVQKRCNAGMQRDAAGSYWECLKFPKQDVMQAGRRTVYTVVDSGKLLHVSSRRVSFYLSMLSVYVDRSGRIKQVVPNQEYLDNIATANGFDEVHRPVTNDPDLTPAVIEYFRTGQPQVSDYMADSFRSFLRQQGHPELIPMEAAGL